MLSLVRSDFFQVISVKTATTLLVLFFCVVTKYNFMLVRGSGDDLGDKINTILIIDFSVIKIRCPNHRIQ